MHGPFGKPWGTLARVHIGQVIMSIRTELQNMEPVIETLLGAKFKFPGHQKIYISKNWAFTKFSADELESMVAEKQLIPMALGPNTSFPLHKWQVLAFMRALALSPPYLCPPINPSCLSKKKKKKNAAFEFCHLSP